MTLTLEVPLDLDRAIQDALDKPVHPDSLVLFQEHPEFPGTLMVDLAHEDMRTDFYRMFDKWVSRHLVLNELFMLKSFCEDLVNSGFYPIFDSSAAPVLEDFHRWNTPLTVPGYTLEDFQNFSLNKALERHRQGTDNPGRFFFWNWSAGAGKSFCSGAGLKALYAEKSIDLAIVCTLSDLKINLARFLVKGGLDAVITDGDKSKRREIYAIKHQAYVMNFEKLRVDFDEIAELVSGRRVVFVLDEAHKLIAEEGSNLSRKALDQLTRQCEATVWPMSATAVGGSPLKYRDVFSLDGHASKNPLGTKKDFVARYASSVTKRMAKTRSGGYFPMVKYEWNNARLQEIRHRIQDRTMAVRRHSDMVTLPYPIQGSPELHRIFDHIIDLAREAVRKEEVPVAHYRLLRQVAVHPGVLAVSQDTLAQEIHAQYPEWAKVPSPKIAALNNILEGISEAQDQAVCFVHWTTGGLHLLAPDVNVKHVKHWGSGQSAKASQKAVDDFKGDPSIVAFMSSDAGSHGLSFQNARYVINIDPVYDFDLLTQRNKRIDRLDSHLDGLTSYVMYVENSVEEYVHRRCDAARKLAAVTQGTVEEMSPEEIALANSPEELAMNWMMFG